MKRLRHLIFKIVAPTIYERTLGDVRPFITFLRERQRSRCWVGAEIGVLNGDNAKRMLERLSIEKLYLIDPYEPYIQIDGKKFNPRASFDVAKQKLAKFGKKAVFIVKESSEAVDEVPDNLDFVYIDGNHAFEFVKKDIELYYPKIRSGGVLGGHDFSPRFLGVCQAVINFSLKTKPYGLEVYGIKTDWFIIKP